MNSSDLLIRRRASERGVSAVEYALLVSLIALASMTAVAALGTSTSEQFVAAGSALGDVGEQGEDVVDDVDDPGAGADEDSRAGEDDSGGTDGSAGNGDADGAGNGNGDGKGNEDSDGAGDGDDDSTGGGEGKGNENSDGDADGTSGGGGKGNGNDGGEGDGDATEDDEDDPDEPGSSVEATETASDYRCYWTSKNRGECDNGAWNGRITFENDWIRHQHLTLTVTKTGADGATTVETVEGFYVPAGSSSTWTSWTNRMAHDRHGNPTEGVVSVEVAVTHIQSSDENWRTTHFDTDGPVVKITPQP